ncbi:MAG: DNA primase [Magnetococcales bacterium]|nr:DNA primase [Magnetococcales bacterium]
MPRYPESLIDQIRDRVDLLELVGRQVHLKKQGTNWLGLCPFHNEKTPSFHVRPDRGFKCFGCGASGDLFDFVMKSKGLDFNAAVEELAGQVGIRLPETRQDDPEAARKRENQDRLLDLLKATREFYQERLASPVGARARHYLAERGMKEETVRRYGLGFAPPGWSHVLDRFGGGEAAAELLEQAGLVTRKAPGEKWYDRFRHRIMFPIADLKGRCVAFGGRVLDAGEPKYLNSPESELFQKGKLLYGLDTAQEAIRKEGSVIVVEGYMDRLSLAENGLEYTVATLGTAMTPEHLRLLWQRTHRIHFCFDGDAAGEKAAWRALELVLDGLDADRHVGFLFLPKGEDPDQVVRREGAEGFAARLSKGVSPIEFLLRHLGNGLELHTPEGRAALAHRARPLLGRIRDPLLRELYAQTLGQRLEIPVQYALEPNTRPPVPMARRVERPARAVAVMERNHEQALLALLLRQPRLVMERDEELSRLRLENAQLLELLTEMITLGHRFADPPSSWPLEQFPTRELALRARSILAAEETPLELAEEEFEGCLVSIHLKALRMERGRLMRRLEREGDEDGALLKRCCALKLEEERMLGNKKAGEGMH